MRFFSKLLLYFTFFIVIQGCVQDISDPVIIGFTDVVGTYSGFSKDCSKGIFTTDTICASGIANILTVQLLNFTTIRVADANKHFSDLLMFYTGDSISNNGRFLFFENKTELELFTLQYKNSDKSVLFIASKSEMDKTSIKIYEGFK